MQVFRVYFKIIKSNLPAMSVYLIVFLVLAVMLSSFNSAKTITGFQEVRTRVAFINRDKPSTLLRGFKDYILKNSIQVNLEDNREKLQDALFYRQAEYIIIIPEGFTESFLKDGKIKLEKYSVPDSATGFYTDMLVNKYLNTARLYFKHAKNLKPEEINGKIANDLSSKAEVQLLNQKDLSSDSIRDSNSNSNSNSIYFFNYLAYALFAILILGVSAIMMVFNSRDLRLRNLASPVSVISINLQLVLGNLVFAFVCWAVMVGAGFILYGGKMTTLNGLYLCMNSFVFTITALCLSFLVGNLINSRGAQAAVSNVLTLGLCFISGVFVPQDLLGESVLRVASFAPTYWYVKANNKIGSLVNFNHANLSAVYESMLIQLAFAVAFLLISLFLGAQKRRTH